MIDSIIFDLDGTLWDATTTVIDCWNEVLTHHDDVTHRFTLEDLQSIMGLTTPKIAEKLIPYLAPERREAIIDECYKAENVFLAEHGGVLFDGMEEMAEKLCKKIPLYIVSNCQKGYVESFFMGNGTGHYFKDHACYEDTNLPKGENIKMLMARNGLKNAIYVGDTMGDKEGAEVAGIPFVYASYGFGEVDSYDYRIDSPMELVALAEKLLAE